MNNELPPLDDKPISVEEFMFLCDFYNSPMKPDWMTWDDVRVILIDMLGKQLEPEEYRGLHVIDYEPGEGMTCFLVFEDPSGTRYHCMIPDNYVEGGNIFNITSRDEEAPEDIPDSLPKNDESEPEPQEEPFKCSVPGVLPLSMVDCDEPEEPAPRDPYAYDEELDEAILEDLASSVATMRDIPRHGNPFREYPTAEERMQGHRDALAQARREYEEAIRNGTPIF